MTKVYELQAVATLTMGISPKGSTYNSDGTGMPLLNGPTEFGAVHPVCTLFTTSPVRTCKAGDLLFCVRGSTGRMNWADRPYAIGRGVAAIRSYSPPETRYLRYYLEAHLPSLLKRAGGGTFPNLRQADIATFPILWPDNRKEIAAVLTAYDELIENNTRRIQVLEDMVQALYREWFVEFRSSLLQQIEIVSSEHGPIPKGWRVVPYGTIADEVKDGVDPQDVDPQTTYVGLEHLPRQSFTMTESGFAYEVSSRKWRFRQGDILFGRLRPYFHKVALAWDSGISSTDIIVIRPKPGMEELALQVAFSPEFVGHAVATSGGTDRPRAQWKDMAKFPVVLPPDPVLLRFAELVRPLIDLAQNLARQNVVLRQSVDLLLPKLVSGEFDVSDLDIDTDWLVA